MSDRTLTVKLTGWKASIACFVLTWLIGSGAVSTAHMIWRAIP